MPQNDEPLEIIEGILNGQTWAINRLFWFMDIPLAGWKGKFSEEEKNDIKEDSFLLIFEAIKEDKIRDKSRFFAYSWSTVHHTCLRFWRSNVRDNRESNKELETSVDYQAENIYRKVWESLSEICREVFKMQIDEGLKYREMAERLGLAEGTIKWRWNRCRKMARKLREKFEKQANLFK